MRYGAARALAGVSLTAEPGTAVAILGANGAGKSTLGRAVSGLVRAEAGSISLDGRDVGALPPWARRRAGIAYLPEGKGIFPELTVQETVRVATRVSGNAESKEKASAEAFAMFPVLSDRRGQRAGTLSGGEQQMLALACALCVHPRLLVVDEPSLGLAPMMVDAVYEVIGRSCEAGLTVVVIEQFVHRALALADQCVVLRRGEVSWSGRAAELDADNLGHYMG